jgi:RNA polymerase sigma factor (sigma-70 family)
MLEEELQALLAAVAAGDENAFAQLSELYTPLVQSMSVRFAPSFSSLSDACAIGVQDLEQEARLALFRAAKTYNLTQRKVSFGLYAKICIRNSLVSALRKSKSRERDLQKSIPPVLSHAEDPLYIASARDASDSLKNRIDQVLSPYEKKIFEQYISGRSVKGISLSVGKSEKSVHNAVYRIRVKIKGLLEN